MEFLYELAVSYLQNGEKRLTALVQPNERLFALYLLSSGVIAYLIYRSAKAKLSAEETTFLRFLFPKKVWSHPSAWLDLRYFVFNALLGKFLLVGLSVAATAISFRVFSGGMDIMQVAGQSGMSTGKEVAISFGFMLVAMFISDFLAWFCHYLQHKSPLLWQFHKVHHSPEVMHPVSNYREHPIDNVLYLSVVGAGYGVILAVAIRVLGYLPSMPMLLGVPLLMIAFNLVGYNLRHSHIWLRWPGKWSMLLPSPAHHHVHHSAHPDHIDKNFAFMFPIWDVIFRTYEMPEDNRDVKFGIGDGNAEELTSCTRLYWVPFRDAYRVMKAQARGLPFNMSKPDPVEDHKVHPAE